MGSVYRITPEQRRRIVEKARKDKEKEMVKALKEKEKSEKLEKEKIKKDYPPTILTMSKRIKTIDPWNSIVKLDKYDSALIVAYKLQQKNLTETRIAVNNKHCWVEFKFADVWYIFDITAITNLELESPIKAKIEANHSFYKQLSSYYNIDDFYTRFENKLTLTKDEAKIEAMEDEGLNTVLFLKYH